MGDEMELCYLRDTMKREVDFVVFKNQRPIFAVECKSGNHEISKHRAYFTDRTTIPMFYQVHMGDKDYEMKVRVLPFRIFASEILKV